MEQEPKEKTCPDCKGTGSLDEEYVIPCPTCHGKGKVPKDYKSWLDKFFETKL